MICLWFDQLLKRKKNLFVFLLVSRVGNLGQGRIETKLVIGPAGSVCRISTVSERS